MSFKYFHNSLYLNTFQLLILCATYQTQRRSSCYLFFLGPAVHIAVYYWLLHANRLFSIQHPCSWAYSEISRLRFCV